MVELTDNIIQLIETIVEKKLAASRLNIRNITSAGDISLSSMGDIRLLPKPGGKVWVGNSTYFTTEDGKLVIHTTSGIREDSL